MATYEKRGYEDTVYVMSLIEYNI